MEMTGAQVKHLQPLESLLQRQRLEVLQLVRTLPEFACKTACEFDSEVGELEQEVIDLKETHGFPRSHLVAEEGSEVQGPPSKLIRERRSSGAGRNAQGYSPNTVCISSDCSTAEETPKIESSSAVSQGGSDVHDSASSVATFSQEYGAGWHSSSSFASKESSDFNSWSQRAVAHKLFDRCFGVLIVLSSVAVGVEVEMQARFSQSYPEAAFVVVQCSFTALFTLELMIRMHAFGWRFLDRHCPDFGWNMFDILVVSVSIGELALQLVEVEGSILVMVRIVRIVRIARLIRVVRYLKQLRSMIFTILNTMWALVWCVMLMTCVVYLFALTLTQATITFRHPSEPDTFIGRTNSTTTSDEGMIELFGSIPAAAYTLFQSITGGVNWGVPARYVFLLGPSYVIMFILYIAFMFFAMLNVITGFFCEHALDLDQLDGDAYLMDQIRQVFEQFDATGVGTITREQFEEIVLSDDGVYSINPLILSG